MSNLYAILFHPRSGSTLVSDMCTNDPEIINFYELLAYDGAQNAGFLLEEDAGKFDPYVQEKMVNRLANLARQRPETKVGFKFAPYQCQSPTMILGALERHNCRTVVVYRRDLVAVALSQIGARQLASEGKLANIAHPSERIQSMKIDIPEFAYFLYDAALERARVLTFARALPESQLMISYEELVRDKTASRAKLSAFLGAELKPVRGVGVRKNLIGKREDYVSNFDEVQEYLRSPQAVRILKKFQLPPDRRPKSPTGGDGRLADVG